MCETVVTKNSSSVGCYMAADEEGISMAKQEHLKRLKQGVKAWNQWREKHPGIHLNLSGADFSSANQSTTVALFKLSKRASLES